MAAEETQTNERRERDAARAASQTGGSLTLRRTITVQHPDTRQWHTFKAGTVLGDDTAWVETMVPGSTFQREGAEVERANLGPVPASGQFRPNAVIGDEAPLEANSLSEEKATIEEGQLLDEQFVFTEPEAARPGVRRLVPKEGAEDAEDKSPAKAQKAAKKQQGSQEG